MNLLEFLIQNWPGHNTPMIVVLRVSDVAPKNWRTVSSKLISLCRKMNQ